MADKKIALPKLNESTKILAIGIAAALATYIISYKILYKSYVNRKTEIHAKMSEETGRLALRKEMAELSNLRTGYNKYLYESADINALRATISELAAKSMVDIIQIQPLNPEKTGNCTKFSFNLRIRASYHQFGRFMESIETYPSLTKVEKFTVFGSAEEAVPERDVITEVSLLISAYCSA